MMTIPVVRRIHTSYFGRYREIFATHENSMRMIKQNGYLEIPPFGRRRYFPVQPPSATEVANYLIQPRGSDYVGMEMCQIEEYLRNRFKGEAGIVAHNHDEFVAEVPEQYAEEAMKVCQQIFGSTHVDGPAGPVELTSTCKIRKHLGK
jgi:DNA polymerase I-like protein with 3'-5' exonuclease and polymerase domains